jgi:hypothetical protein
MDIKSVKELAQKYTVTELNQLADDFEATGKTSVKTQDDPGDQMSDFLQAAELRSYLDQGLSITEAVREFSKRVRGVLG